MTEDRRWPTSALGASALAAALLVVPYVAFLGNHQLWQPFEPDLVEVAREMRASGDLLVPRLDGTVYAEKPPLYYWSALAFASMRGGLDETAARLPSALAALALVAVTAVFGARLFGPRAGLLAGVILGTTPLVFMFGTCGNCDMPLALATTCALLALHLAVCEEEARGRWLIVAGLAVGVSVVAKSLVGPAIVLLAAGPALALDRERRLPRWGWWGLAALAALAVVLPWYVAVAAREGWQFLDENLLRQTIGRFFGAERKGRLYSYLLTLPQDLLPWTFFLPALAVHARRVRGAEPARWRRLRALLVAVGANLVFLSLSQCRIHKYVLPLFPLLAIAIAATLDGAAGELERRLVVIPALVLAVALSALAVAAPFLVVGPLPSLFEPAVLCGAIALPGAAALYLVARSAPPRTIGLGLAVVVAVLLVGLQHAVYPALDDVRSDKPLQAAIRTFVGAETPYAGYRMGVRSYLIFYTERRYELLDQRPGLDRWLASAGGRPAYVLTREATFRELAADRLLGPRLAIVGRNPPGVAHDDFVLVRVAPPG